MNDCIKKYFLGCLLLLPSLFSFAQGLQKLPKAKEINVGVLQNGAETYLVKNNREAGYADFALVRQVNSDGSGIRDALSRLPHFLPDSPFEFLLRYGIACGPDGYVTVEDEYETVRFSHVPVWNGQVCDSTLLLIFDMMSLSTAPQAVFVCGDIDVAKIRERSDVLSLMASSLSGKKTVSGKEWNPHDSVRFVNLQAGTQNAAAVKLIYSAERTSYEYMNTMVPMVTDMFAEELGLVVGSRLRTLFRKAGIPLADVSCSYKDSSSDTGDERFTLSLVVPNDRLKASLCLVGSVLGTLDREGASMRELVVARNRMVSSCLDRPEGKTNSEYLDKCLKSYKYGSDLAPDDVVDPIFARRGVGADNELGLFNDFVSALLDPEKNLVLRIDAPGKGVNREEMLAEFHKGWEGGSDIVPGTDLTDFGSQPSKVKLSGELTEPVTGGLMWTFSNGMNVIFKEENTPGEMRYAFFVSGGRPSIPGLTSGEAAWAGGMFQLCGAGGKDADSFGETLAAMGISMKASVSMSSLRLSGTAPSDRLPDVLDAVRTMSSGVNIDREAYDYYIRSQMLKLDSRALYPRNVSAKADSVISPGYLYSDNMTADVPGADFPAKMEGYFNKSLSRLNESVLVLTGDLKADALKKELPRLLGGFKTGKSASAQPKVSYPMISGRVLLVEPAAAGLVGGKELGVNLCLSTRQPFGNEEIMTFRIALMVLQRELSKAMAECGYFVEFHSREENYPKSSFTVNVSCRPCRPSGLPSGVEIKDELYVLSVMRKVVDNIPDVALSGEELRAFKTLLKSSFDAEDFNPETVLRRVEARYCEGRDLVSGARKTIDGVTEKEVREMLAFLISGAGVEYVIL